MGGVPGFQEKNRSDAETERARFPCVVRGSRVIHAGHGITKAAFLQSQSPLIQQLPLQQHQRI